MVILPTEPLLSWDAYAREGGGRGLATAREFGPGNTIETDPIVSRQNKILASLGLRKRMTTVYHPVSPDIAGKIMKVKELLAVSETEKAETKKEMHERRKPPVGFVGEGNALRD